MTLHPIRHLRARAHQARIAALIEAHAAAARRS